MSIKAFLQDLMSAGILALISYVVKEIFKAATKQKTTERKRTYPPKKQVTAQFFIAFFVMLLSLTVFFSYSTIIVRCFAGAVSVFSFILIWGAFDAAVIFYPLDSTNDAPGENLAHLPDDEPANQITKND